MKDVQIQSPEKPSVKKKLSDYLSLFLPILRHPLTGLLLAFLCPAILLLLIYLRQDGGSIVFAEYGEEFIAHFEAFRSIVKGAASPFYSFAATGADYLGSFLSFFASPFSFLLLLFSGDKLVAGIKLVALLRTALTGLSFGFYLQRSKKTSNAVTVIGALVYALSSHAIMAQLLPLLGETLLFFPLVALGMEKLFTEKRFILFSVSLFFLLATAPTAIVPVFACVLLYFVYLITAGVGLKGKALGFGVLRFFLFGALSTGLATVVWLSALYALPEGMEAIGEVYTNFDIAALLIKLFPASYDSASGTPFLYFGVLSLILIPLYFLRSSLPMRRRIAGFVSVFVLFLFLYFRPVSLAIESITHSASTLPALLGYRYAFLLLFLLCIFACDALESIEEQTTRSIFLSAALWGVAVVILQQLNYMTGFGENEPVLHAIRGAWLTVFAVVCYAFSLLGIKSFPKKKNAILSLIAVLVAAELCLSGVQTMNAANDEIGFIYTEIPQEKIGADTEKEEELPDPTWYNRNKELYSSVEYIKKATADPFFRVKNPFGTNSALYYGLKGGDTEDCKYFGCADTSNPIHNAVFRIRYAITKGSELSGSFTKTFTDSKTGYAVYENKIMLPFFMTASDVESFSEETNPIKRTNAFLSSVSGYETEVYEITTAIIQPSGKYSLLANGEKMYIGITDGAAITSITVTQITASGGNEFTNTIEAEAEGEYLHGVYELAICKKGEQLIVSVSGDDVSDEDVIFAALDENALAAHCLAANGTETELTECKGTLIKGKVSLAENGTVVTSIPYDRHFSVVVDGEEVEGLRKVNGLLSFDVDAGAHKIEIRHGRPSYFTVALSVTAVSAALMIAVSVLFVLAKRKVIKNAPAFFGHLLPLKEANEEENHD